MIINNMQISGESAQSTANNHRSTNSMSNSRGNGINLLEKYAQNYSSNNSSSSDSAYTVTLSNTNTVNSIEEGSEPVEEASDNINVNLTLKNAIDVYSLAKTELFNSSVGTDAYQVEISLQSQSADQSSKIEESQFELEQEQNTREFERTQNKDETEFEKEQQTEERAFEQEQQRKEANFESEQQRDEAQFYQEQKMKELFQ